MSKTDKYKGDLIGDEWKESTENTFYKSEGDIVEPIDSYFDENKRTELALNEIDRLTNEALSRNIIGKLNLKSKVPNSNIKKKSTFIIYLRDKVSSNYNIYVALSILVATLLIIAAYYLTFYSNMLSRHQGMGLAILIGFIIRAILITLKTNNHALIINPFYIKMDKIITINNINTTIFFNDILGISFSDDDFKDIDSNSKFDGVIQFIKDENKKEVTDTTLYIFYETNDKLEILSIDLDRIEINKLQFLRFFSALLRSDSEQRQDILSAHNHTFTNIEEELPEQDELRHSEENDNFANAKVDLEKPVDAFEEKEIVVNNSEPNTSNNNTDNQYYELCYNRPGNIMYSEKKDVIKINTERIFLSYGICNEEDDINIAFDNIIGIAYDEFEAKKGIAQKSRELETYIYNSEDEEISIYHKQENRFVNTKIYIYKTDSEQEELIDLIILLHKHNVEQRKKILQMHKS